MSIWIDGKNPALYSGGISAWLKGLMSNFDQGELSEVVFVSPRAGNNTIYPDIEMNRRYLPWFSFLPSKFRHLIYDKLTFRLFTKIGGAKLIFSPYFDLSVPKSSQLIITIHDLCYLEVPELYSKLQVLYYTRALRRNMGRAMAIVTVSQSSKQSISSNLQIDPTKILVVPNRLDDEFANYQPSHSEVDHVRSQLASGMKIILYTSGFENRKNIPGLIQALSQMLDSGSQFQLVVTGDNKNQWLKLLGPDSVLLKRISFVGFLTLRELKKLYCAADVVVYPSLSEGFGRACLEAINAGTPLACSDLPVFHEVAGSYAEYFSPSDPKEMANALNRALVLDRKSQVKPSSTSNFDDLKTLKTLIFGKSQTE
jgi:glycosyltransferase involved in cell wall biosynthesis